MGKYDNLKVLKKTKARVNHTCSFCGRIIQAGDYYYAEDIKDKFLHSLHRKKYCYLCYQKIKSE
jgi:hypothetical protein